MSTAPDVYVGPAFVGWRSWRILPFERLGKTATIRLAASGTHGLPKFWAPGASTAAACGKFDTTHDAPWPECECGLYAYRVREDAWEHLKTFRESTNGDAAVGWAFGRVSLWGRIVECERGWRAEHAYPYAIDVYAEPDVAAKLRDLYGVDVEQHPPFPEPAQTEDESLEEDESREGAEWHEEVARLLEQAKTHVDELQRSLSPRDDNWKAAAERTRARNEEQKRLVAALPALQVEPTDEEVLVAVLAAIAVKRERPFCSDSDRFSVRNAKRRHATAVNEGEITHALLMLRGEAGTPYPYHVSYCDRTGYDSCRYTIRRTLQRLTEGGTLVCGNLPGYQNRHWRISESGRKMLGNSGWPRTVVVSASARGIGRDADRSVAGLMPTRTETVSVAASYRSLSYPPSPFVEEIVELTPDWRAERQAMQKKSRKSYRDWLTTVRDECEQLDLMVWARLVFTEDDVLAELSAASANEPVPFAGLRDRLLPDSPQGGATQSETSGLARALSQLRKRGAAERTEGQGGALWSAKTPIGAVNLRGRREANDV